MIVEYVKVKQEFFRKSPWLIFLPEKGKIIGVIMKKRLRLHLQNDIAMIEWIDTPAGLLQAKAFRKSHPEFKNRHIRSVLQAMPDLVKCEKIYLLTLNRFDPIREYKYASSI